MEKNFNKELKKSVAYLHFEDGTSFKGFVNKPNSDEQLQNGLWGEAAFTTGMSGYEETITDPSFWVNILSLQMLILEIMSLIETLMLLNLLSLTPLVSLPEIFLTIKF